MLMVATIALVHFLNQRCSARVSLGWTWHALCVSVERRAVGAEAQRNVGDCEERHLVSGMHEYVVRPLFTVVCV